MQFRYFWIAWPSCNSETPFACLGCLFACFGVNCMFNMPFKQTDTNDQANWSESSWRQLIIYFQTCISKTNIQVWHGYLFMLDMIIYVSYINVCIVNVWCWTWHYERIFHGWHGIVDSNQNTDIELCVPAHSWRRQFERVFWCLLLSKTTLCTRRCALAATVPGSA